MADNTAEATYHFGTTTQQRIDDLCLGKRICHLPPEQKDTVSKARKQFISNCLTFPSDLKTAPRICTPTQKRERGAAFIPPKKGKKSQDSKKAYIKLGERQLTMDKSHDGKIHTAYLPKSVFKTVKDRGCYDDGTVFTTAEHELAYAFLSFVSGRKEDEDDDSQDCVQGQDTIPEEPTYISVHSSVIKRLSRGKLAEGRRFDEFRSALINLGILAWDPTYCPQNDEKGVVGKTYGYRTVYSANDEFIPVKLSGDFRLSSRFADAPTELEFALTESYRSYSCPTLADVKARAETLDACNDPDIGYRKGKKLIYAAHNPWKISIDEWKKRGVCLLDRGVKSYKNAINRGCKIPCASSGCPRIYDTFSLMAFWIRQMVLIDGQSTVELDLSSLHPFLLYGIFRRYLPKTEQDYFENVLACNGDVHRGVALELQRIAPEKYGENTLDDIRKTVKKQHLTFFNEKVPVLRGMDIYKVYKCMPTFVSLLEITKDVVGSPDDYKQTSRILIGLEVDLMTEIVRELYAVHIHFIYVFDALMVACNRAEEAQNIMDSVAQRLGLLTRAKAK